MRALRKPEGRQEHRVAGGLHLALHVVVVHLLPPAMGDPDAAAVAVALAGCDLVTAISTRAALDNPQRPMHWPKN